VLTEKQKLEIKNFLTTSFQTKIKNYKRKTKPNHFVKKLMQDDKLLAQYSFIHSLHGFVGKRFFENLAVMIAKENSTESEIQKQLPLKIDKGKIDVIESLMDNFGNKTRKPNKDKEIKEILSKSTNKFKNKKAWSLVDFYMKKKFKRILF